jgi:hypothetical protein
MTPIPFLFLVALGAASAGGDSLLLSSDDARGIRVVATRAYDGTALYGYMDGGADLYFEYGFRSLSVQQIVARGETLTVEVFRMQDAAGAYGLFSLGRSRCQSVESLGRHACRTRYHVQCAAGNVYFRVVNALGCDTGECLRVAGMLRASLNGPEYALPSPFDREPFARLAGDVRLMKGPLGVQNGFPGLEESLDGVDRFTLWVSASASVTFALIRFEALPDRAEFCRRVGVEPSGCDEVRIVRREGMTRAVRCLDDGSMLFLETPLQRAAVSFYITAMGGSE